MAMAEAHDGDLAAFFEHFSPEDWPVSARSNQGVILRVRTGDLDLAVKTPSGRGLGWYARRFSLLREHRAYRRIEGLPGFPRCLGLFEGRYLAIEYVRGELLRQTTPDDRETFFGRLRTAIEAMHDRGVAHGDLKSRRNVIITDDGRPMIIDLGTAVIRKPGRHLLNRWLFDYMRQIDLNGWVKLKYGSYDRVDELDRHLVRRTRIERINNWARRRGL